MTPDKPDLWMELDEALERPAIPGAPERVEAPLSEASVRLRRRDFLKLAGLSASLAACERLPVKHAMPYLVPPEGITPGVAVHYATTCFACPAACGLVASVRDGRPVKLEGHPHHLLSRGGLCALGQADHQRSYRRERDRVIDDPRTASRQIAGINGPGNVSLSTMMASLRCCWRSLRAIFYGKRFLPNG